MQKEAPKRIVIIGLPGSGKSTLAARLGNLLNTPVHHLDKHRFIGKNKRDPKDFFDTQQDLVNQESWIIEGCSIKTLEIRFARADTIIYLHFPRLVCIWRVLKRAFTIDQHLSRSGCANFVNWELLKYIWNFKKEKDKQIKALQSQYSNLTFYELQSANEVKNFLCDFILTFGK